MNLPHTKINYIIFHISEFTYLIATGQIKIHSNRIENYEIDSDQNIFLNSGYLKYTEPESYLICVLKADFQFSNEKFSEINLVQIEEIIPLTTQAEVLLRPMTSRSHLVLSTPKHEHLWQEFVNQEILKERLSAAHIFIKLFNSQDLIIEKWLPKDNLYEFIIKDLGNVQSEIEKRIESSELGVFEFCVRIAQFHDQNWRNTNQEYNKLRDVRISQLSNKKSSEFLFIESPELCNALKSFETESFEKFGYSPFCLSAFFEFYRRYAITKRLDLSEIIKVVNKLLQFGLKEDASNYIYLIGYAAGIYEVAPLNYDLNQQKFPIFNIAKFGTNQPVLEISFPVETLDPFLVPEKPLIEETETQVPNEEAETKVPEVTVVNESQQMAEINSHLSDHSQVPIQENLGNESFGKTKDIPKDTDSKKKTRTSSQKSKSKTDTKKK